MDDETNKHTDQCAAAFPTFRYGNLSTVNAHRRPGQDNTKTDDGQLKSRFLEVEGVTNVNR